MARWIIASIMAASVIVPPFPRSVCTASVFYAAHPMEFAGIISSAGAQALPQKRQEFRSRIRSVLKSLHPLVPYSDHAVELLFMTAAHETKLGWRLVQTRGPARGIFQMEPKTERYILDRLRLKHPMLHDRVMAAAGWSWNSSLLTENIDYQIAMARVYYFLRSREVPKASHSMAEAAKRHWNTKHGKAKASDYLIAYHRYR